MNRRLVKPFFSIFLQGKTAQLNAKDIINILAMDNKEQVIKSKDKCTKAILESKHTTTNKNINTSKANYKQIRYFSTNSINFFLKIKHPLLQKNSKINLQRFYTVYPTRTTSAFNVGDEATLERKITEEDIKKFIEISGDSNPIHVSHNNKKAVVHGAFLNSLVSNVIGTQLPGPGTVVIKQILNFPNKCFVGEVVHVNVKVAQDRKIIKVEFKCTSKVQDGKGSEKVVLFGEAKLINKATNKEDEFKPRGL